MTKFLNLAMIALLAVAFIGCGGEDDKKKDTKKDAKKDAASTQIESTTPVSLESNIAAKKGESCCSSTEAKTESCCSDAKAKTDSCCSGEKSTCKEGAADCCKSKADDKDADTEKK